MLDILGSEHHDGVDHSIVAKSGKMLAGHEDGIAKLFSGIEPGSMKAKQLWSQVNTDAHSPTMVAKGKLIHLKAVGFYKGGALVPGENGTGQADWKLLHDKLVFSNGYSPEVADKICGSINHRLYGAH